MIKIKHIVMIYILFVILITTLSARIIIDKNKEINNLKETNKELSKINIEYKWQLEQVPLMIESNKENICGDFYESK